MFSRISVMCLSSCCQVVMSCLCYDVEQFCHVCLLSVVRELCHVSFIMWPSCFLVSLLSCCQVILSAICTSLQRAYKKFRYVCLLVSQYPCFQVVKQFRLFHVIMWSNCFVMFVLYLFLRSFDMSVTMLLSSFVISLFQFVNQICLSLLGSICVMSLLFCCQVVISCLLSCYQEVLSCLIMLSSSFVLSSLFLLSNSFVLSLLQSQPYSVIMLLSVF